MTLPTVPRRTLILIGLLILFFTGLYFILNFYQKELKKTESQGPTISEIKRTGDMVFGTSGINPPLEYLDSKGNLVGFDIDLSKRIANEIGVEADIKNFPHERLFKELDEGKIDLIISSATKETALKYNLDSTQVYLTKGEKEFVILLPKKDKEFTKLLDNIIHDLRQKGVLFELEQKWFK